MILHLVSVADWKAAPPGQPFTPTAYAADGFIHCTFGDALMLSVANRFYKSQPGEFLAIAIDEARVAAPVKWEAPATPGPGEPPSAPPTGPLPPEAEAEFGSAAAEAPAMPLFPHIYGPLNRDAILGARRFMREPDGTFSGYAPVEEAAPAPAANPANPLNLKTAGQLANELVDATDEFSKSLDRYKDSIEARMAELDKKIKKL